MGNETVTLKYFHASWCGPCSQKKSTINAIESEYGVEVALEQHHIQAEDGCVEKYNIRNIPLVIVETESGTERLTGVIGRDKTDKAINRVIDTLL